MEAPQSHINFTEPTNQSLHPPSASSAVRVSCKVGLKNEIQKFAQRVAPAVFPTSGWPESKEDIY